MSQLNAAEILGKRTVILATFGLVGVGAIFGAGSVYYFYIRRKFEEQFSLHRTINSEIHLLKSEVSQLKCRLEESTSTSTSSKSNSNAKVQQVGRSSLKSSLREPQQNVNGGRRMVKFANGYETTDEDEYLTASSSENESDDTDYPFKREDERHGSGDAPRNGIISLDTQFFNKVDKMFDGDGESQREAYNCLKLNQDNYQHSCDFWWRFAKATHYLGMAAKNCGDVPLRKTLVYEACEKASKALELDDKCADAHKWFAITLGSKGDFLGVNEKIQNGYLFKEHIDRAVELNPSDSTLYHLLGRFCYEVSQLSWIERRVASTLFSTPPTSDPQEALAHFQSTEKLGKPFKENRLFIAKCYIALSDYGNAAHWLKQGSSLPVVSESDKAAEEEIIQLLSKYETYLL